MGNSPTHNAFGETRQGRKRVMLVPIGVAWQHDNGRNYTIQLDALPLEFNGRIVLLDDRASKPGKDGGQ